MVLGQAQGTAAVFAALATGDREVAGHATVSLRLEPEPAGGGSADDLAARAAWRRHLERSLAESVASVSHLTAEEIAAELERGPTRTGRANRSRSGWPTGCARAAATAESAEFLAAGGLTTVSARWIFSSTKASSSSRRSASRCPTVERSTRCDEAVAAADAVGYPVVVKAQVHVGGRGKAGGVKLATDADEVREHAEQHPRHGHQGPHGARSCGSSTPPTSPRSTTPASPSIGRPRSTSACCRPQGGVEIETVADENPDAIAKIWIDPVDGLDRGRLPRRGSLAAKLDPEATDGAVDILRKLYTAYVEGDADLSRSTR